MTTKQKYKKVAYYPGCALEGSGHSYNRSTKAVGKALGLDLVEVKNWNCCGAMEVKNVDPKLQTYLSSRVMSVAANEMDMDVVMAPCNGCYHNLKKAEYDLANDKESVDVVDKLSKKAGHKTYESGQVETIHALDWIKEAIGEDGLRERVRNSLSGIKIANYYGCMYTRPRHIFPEKDQGPGSESTSKPHFMDDLLAAAGAENVEFPLKTACCGGAHTLSDSDTSTKLVLNILKAAKMAGADVIATECPTCHSGLEMHQIRAEKTLGEKVDIKILYFTQLLGMALGLKARKVGVHENMLALSEEVLEHWVTARGDVPTNDEREGFRLLALHRQGAKGDPSFNACRETCREVAYHYNLVKMQPQATDITDRLQMMMMVSSPVSLHQR
jgi:heterodisulfide reductase subunit B